MKKLLFILLFAVFLPAQITVDSWNPNVNGLEVRFEGAADTVGGTYATIYSEVYELADYDANAAFYFSYLLTSSAGSPKLDLTIVGSDYVTAGASMSVIDSLGVGITGETAVYGNLDMNGKRPKYIRFKVTAIALGRDDQTFKIRFKAAKRDY